jgi:hypothetical protein
MPEPIVCAACGLDRATAEYASLELDLWDAECCDIATWINICRPVSPAILAEGW